MVSEIFLWHKPWQQTCISKSHVRELWVAKLTDNVTAGSKPTEEFFRQTIYVSFLETIASDLEGWFGDLQKKMMNINVC